MSDFWSEIEKNLAGKPTNSKPFDKVDWSGLEEYNLEMAARQPLNQDWQKMLKKALGYEPSLWRGTRHSRDQLIGILRELEDGSDPHSEDRKNATTEGVDRLLKSRRIERDDRDAELGNAVDYGEWRSPAWRRTKILPALPNPGNFAKPEPDRT